MNKLKIKYEKEGSKKHLAYAVKPNGKRYLMTRKSSLIYLKRLAPILLKAHLNDPQREFLRFLNT